MHFSTITLAAVMASVVSASFGGHGHLHKRHGNGGGSFFNTTSVAQPISSTVLTPSAPIDLPVSNSTIEPVYSTPYPAPEETEIPDEEIGSSSSAATTATASVPSSTSSEELTYTVVPIYEDADSPASATVDSPAKTPAAEDGDNTDTTVYVFIPTPTPSAGAPLPDYNDDIETTVFETVTETISRSEAIPTPWESTVITTEYITICPTTGLNTIPTSAPIPKPITTTVKLVTKTSTFVVTTLTKTYGATSESTLSTSFTTITLKDHCTSASNTTIPGLTKTLTHTPTITHTIPKSFTNSTIIASSTGIANSTSIKSIPTTSVKKNETISVTAPGVPLFTGAAGKQGLSVGLLTTVLAVVFMAALM